MRPWTFFFALTMWAADKPAVADFGWMAGHWSGRLGPMAIHETWTPPHEGNMAATFRMMREGKVTLYELITLEDQASGPVMKLRHFDGAMMAREQKPHEFVLVEVSGEAGQRRAKFREDEGGGVVTTLVYRETEGGLAVDFEKTGEKPQRVTFAFSRGK